MKLVVIESPFAGDVERNLRFLSCCMRDCIRRGEAPFASHGLYAREGCLNDAIQEERDLGIAAGLAWGDKAEARAVYTNLGVSHGMELGIVRAKTLGQPIEFRRLDEEQWPTERRETHAVIAQTKTHTTEDELRRAHRALDMHGAPPGADTEARLRALVIQHQKKLEESRFRKLPRERKSITRKIPIGPANDLYITADLYEDGTLGGVLLKMAKMGDELSGFMDALSICISLGLKHGVPLAKFCKKLTNLRFEPSGFTGQKDIPHVESPVDALAKWMALRFLPPVLRVGGGQEAFDDTPSDKKGKPT